MAGPESSCCETTEASGSDAELGDVLASERERVEVSFGGEPLGEDEGGVLEPRPDEGTIGGRIIDIVLFDDVYQCPATSISLVVIKPCACKLLQRDSSVFCT
ncbi:hypothetical protein NL676_008396 [Syzygium grande]|nr:hypothetical protein NL676_008396 [Syzygium grande]